MAMKTFTLVLSNLLLFFISYVFYNNFKSSTELNYLLFMALLVVSMLICVLTSIINIIQLLDNKKRNKTLHYNSYSDSRIKDNKFYKSFVQLNF